MILQRLPLILYHNKGKGERGYDEEKRQSIVTCISGYPYCFFRKCSAGGRYIDKSTEYTGSEGRGAESGSTEQYCKSSEGCKSKSGKRTECNCESNENNSCRWKYSGYHDEYRKRECQQSRSDYTCGLEWNRRQSLSVQSGCNIQNERYIGFRNELFGKSRQCKAEISYLRIVL